MANQSREQTRVSDDDDYHVDETAEFIDAERELPGSVYKVPDKMWGFDAIGRIEHPGACTSCNVQRRQAVLLKGTDAEGARRGYPQVVVISSSPTNGLTKPTAFAVEPRVFRLRKVELIHKDRLIGTLDSDELDLLRDALERAFRTA